MTRLHEDAHPAEDAQKLRKVKPIPFQVADEPFAAIHWPWWVNDDAVVHLQAEEVLSRHRSSRCAATAGGRLARQATRSTAPHRCRPGTRRDGRWCPASSCVAGASHTVSSTKAGGQRQLRMWASGGYAQPQQHAEYEQAGAATRRRRRQCSGVIRRRSVSSSAAVPARRQKQHRPAVIVHRGVRRRRAWAETRQRPWRPGVSSGLRGRPSPCRRPRRRRRPASR